jgi:hypothetical protein
MYLISDRNNIWSRNIFHLRNKLILE